MTWYPVLDSHLQNQESNIIDLILTLTDTPSATIIPYLTHRCLSFTSLFSSLEAQRIGNDDWQHPLTMDTTLHAFNDALLRRQNVRLYHLSTICLAATVTDIMCSWTGAKEGLERWLRPGPVEFAVVLGLHPRPGRARRRVDDPPVPHSASTLSSPIFSSNVSRLLAQTVSPSRRSSPW